MSKTHVMLRRDWPGTFSRSVREKKDPKKIKKTLSFEPGIPLELTDTELKLVEKQIGVNLFVVEIDESGRARQVISDKEREEAALAMAEKGKEVESLKKAVIEQQKQLEEAETTIVDLQAKILAMETSAAEAAATIAEYEELLEESDDDTEGAETTEPDASKVDEVEVQ